MREERRVAGLGIAPLRAGAVDVNKVVVAAVAALRTCIGRATHSAAATARTALALRLHLVQLP